MGYRKTTTKAIEQSAAVMRGAVLHHYPSKADSLVATVALVGERWQQHQNDPNFVTAVDLTRQFLAGAASVAAVAPTEAPQVRLIAEWCRMITPMPKPSPRSTRAH
jgi:AcrR family transcriptional regulator